MTTFLCSFSARRVG